MKEGDKIIGYGYKREKISNDLTKEVKSMARVQEVSPEIISCENYEPTKIENLFINSDDNSAVIVGSDGAYKIELAQINSRKGV